MPRSKSARQTVVDRILSVLANVEGWRTASDISQILAFDVSTKEVAQRLRPLVSDGTVEKDMPMCQCGHGCGFHADIAKYRLIQNVQ